MPPYDDGTDQNQPMCCWDPFSAKETDYRSHEERVTRCSNAAKNGVRTGPVERKIAVTVRLDLHFPAPSPPVQDARANDGNNQQQVAYPSQVLIIGTLHLFPHQRQMTTDSRVFEFGFEVIQIPNRLSNGFLDSSLHRTSVPTTTPKQAA